MKTIINKTHNKLRGIMIAASTFVIAGPMTAYAADPVVGIDDTTSIAGSSIAKGIALFLNDATNWLLGLAPVIGCLFLIYAFIKKGSCDESETKKWHNRIVMIIVCTAGAEVASVFIKIALHYISA